MIANVRWGVLRGLWAATAFSVFVIAEYLLLGSAPFTNIGTSLHVVLAIYFCGGITAGAIVGALRPFTRTRPGAIAVGILAAFVVGTGIIWTKSGSPNHWAPVDWASVIICSVIYGTMFSSEETWNGQ
jgi:riboflavin transporter FmnP